MNLLLDTHTLFWWLEAPEMLSRVARSAIVAPENTVSVSIVNAWEMAIKVGSGRWPEAAELVDAFEDEVAAEGFGVVGISIPHVRAAGLLLSKHRDPFDRLLAVQAMAESMTLVSADSSMANLGAAVLW